MVADSRYLVHSIKDGLLESVAESTDGLDGASNPHPNFFVFQGLIIGDIIWQLAGGDTWEGGRERRKREHIIY